MTPASGFAALTFAAAAGAVGVTSAQTPPPLSTAHDGQWNVTLVCDDVSDRRGVVKGYTFVFPVTVDKGRLEGRYTDRRSSAFVTFVGQVHSDGTLAINAAGESGSPDYTVGRMRPGTPYAYTMKGRLDTDEGRAERIELRPCTATFRKSPG